MKGLTDNSYENTVKLLCADDGQGNKTVKKRITLHKLHNELFTYMAVEMKV